MATRRIVFYAVSALIFCTLFAGNARAFDDWLPIDPAQLKMTSEPLAPGAPAIYLYRQVDRKDNTRATTEHNYLRIKILTEDGRKYGDIEIPFEKEQYHVNGIRARTIRPDGSIVNFDGKIYENTIVKSKTYKYLAKTFTMPDVSVGCIVEYEFNYDYTDNYIFNSRWILSEELFTKRAKFSLKPYDGPGWSVQWISPAGLPPGTTPAKEDPDRTIRMVAENIPAFQTEDYMPPENELKFRVTFIYHDGPLELNQDKYWNSFGKKQNGKAEDFVNKKKAMEQAVSQIVSPADAPLVKLQKIYARTQRVRNLSFEESKTEQQEKRENLKEATNVEDVWKNQFGSGWNITWLFLGLARAAGFEAYPCLISGRSEYFFKKERLDSSQLNTNVVLVKLDGKNLFFDPGAKFTPFGLLPWMETGVQGLKLDKEGGKWIVTEIPESDASRIERKGDFKLLDEGSLEGKLTVSWTGLAGMRRRVDQRNTDETERKKYLEDEVKGAIAYGCDLELTNHPDWVNSEVPLVGEFTLKIPGYASAAGRKALLPATPFSAEEKHMFEHADRVYPVYFEYLYKKLDSLSIDLPLGWKASTLPPPFDLDAKAAEYKLTVEDDKGVLSVHREIRSDVLIVPTNAYGTLRNFYQTIRSQDDKQIVLLPGGTATSQ